MGQLRQAASDAAYRFGPSQFEFAVYPTQSLQAAVRRLHFDEGYDQASTELDTVLTRTWSSGVKAGKGRSARQQFDNYVAMDRLDDRMPYAHVEREVEFGANSVNVRIDVALIEDRGYSGRVVIWSGTTAPSGDIVDFTACACAKALEEEMGRNRVVAIEVWHPRSSTIIPVRFREARRHDHRLQATLHRAAPS
jgi:hypothetical protein